LKSSERRDKKYKIKENWKRKKEKEKEKKRTLE